MGKRLIARAGLCLAFVTALGSAGAVSAAGAPAAVRTAVLTGQVFADTNSNEHADRGEGLRGAELKLNNWDNQKTYRVTTGADGRFRLVVPTGTYYVGGGHNRWRVVAKIFHLHTGGRKLPLRAVRPLGKHVLSAHLHFTKDRYAVGDRVHIAVRLTNEGSTVLRGIGAQCDHVGDRDELYNKGPGWGRLAAYGPGVDLKPHTTRTFDVRDRVPAAAGRFGQVVIECDFGYADVIAGHRPDAYDTAKVPGEFGALAGDVGRYRHGNLIGLAHVRVVLADPGTCPVYTRRTTTDHDGHFRIAHAPAGSTYKLYVYPPPHWKVRDDNPGPAIVIGHDTTHFVIDVKHGHKRAPKLPRCS